MQPATLEFRNLPLLDVAVKVWLRQRLPVSMPFVCDLHQSLKSDFPELSDLSMLESPPGTMPEIRVEAGMTTRGARFFEPSSGVSIVIQANLLSVRWNQDLISPSGRYPGFRLAILPAYRKLVDVLKNMLGPESVRASIVNMSYVNFVRQDPPIKWKDVEAYVRLGAPTLLPTALRFHGFEMAMQATSDVDFSVSIRVVDADNMPVPSGFVLKNEAGARVPHPGDGEERLVSVHDVLIRTFSEMLTEHASKEWERI